GERLDTHCHHKGVRDSRDPVSRRRKSGYEFRQVDFSHSIAHLLPAMHRPELLRCTNGLLRREVKGSLPPRLALVSVVQLRRRVGTARKALLLNVGPGSPSRDCSERCLRVRVHVICTARGEFYPDAARSTSPGGPRTLWPRVPQKRGRTLTIELARHSGGVIELEFRSLDSARHVPLA